MTQVVETVRENRWRNGKRFLYLNNIVGLVAGAEENILICVGDKPVVIESITIEANVEKLTWEVFAGSVITDGTGIEVVAIPRNSIADSAPGLEVIKQPTVTDSGASLSELPLNLVAQVYRNNSYYMSEKLLTNDFVFDSDTCYMIQLKNTSADTTDISLNIGISNT